jgi:NitT/TauT family transport system substrate-binding protein
VRVLQPGRHPRLAADGHGQALHARLPQARAWVIDTPAAKIAEAEASFFPEIEEAVLTSTLAYYQKLGCWTPHVEITRPAFEVALDVFQHAGLITKRHAYGDVVAAPPDAA